MVLKKILLAVNFYKIITMKYRPRPRSNKNNKVRRKFGSPVSPLSPHPTFFPIPPDHIQPADLSYQLGNLLTKSQMNSIQQSGKIVFHMVGDTGGISGTQVQDAIAVQMENQFQQSSNGIAPSFFFHLGDVIYYNGQSANYLPQFYDPYKYYPAPIFAIPGNHDGDPLIINKLPVEPSLTGFFENFCSPSRQTTPNSPYRYTMDQPWPYFVLNTPFATIIGLYSNVDGSLDDPSSKSQPQYDWFVQQLSGADKNKCLLLTLHHPPYSLDAVHGGYQDMLDAIDQASQTAKRYPDAVFTGHVHNYQRFTRKINKNFYPYVIAGAGGYADAPKSMHKLQDNPKTGTSEISVPFQTTLKDVVFEKYNTSQPGFLRITIDKQTLTGEYFINSFDNTPPPLNAFDVFTLNWKNHTMQ